MADWIHCNSCYRQPGVGKQFFLTNCGHIFCQDCLPPGNNEPCKVCKEVYKSTPLTSELTPEVAMYFTDPIELLQKHQKQLDLIYQVVEFQRNHRKRLTMYNYEKMQSLSAKMSEAMAVVEKMHNIDVENQRLKKELEFTKKENGYMKQLLKTLETRQSPNILTRAHGDEPPKDSSSLIRVLGRDDNLSQSSKFFDKPSKRSCDREDGFSAKVTSNSSQPAGNSVSVVPQFNFRTPNSVVSHISPGLARLSVRTPPSNGKLGVIPHYPASRNQTVYTPAMPSVRESPRSMDTNEKAVVAAAPKSAPPATDRLFARFQVNYPNLKP